MAETDEIVTYIKRAFELKGQQCYKQAIEMFYKAISIEPDNIDIMFQLGELYYLLENYPRAIQYGEQILEIDNKNIQAMELLTKVYLKQNELYSAKGLAETIYEQHPSADNLLNLIGIFGGLELFDDIEKYRSEIDKNDKCLLSYAKSLYASSNSDKSLEITDKLLNINPDCEEGLVLKGKIFFGKNKTEEAKEIFNRFDKYTHNPEVLNYQGLFALDELNFADAIKLFSKAKSLDNKNSLYSYNLGNAYFLNGWYKEAVNAYKDAILLSPENIDYRYSLAYIYYEHKEYDKSGKEVASILDIESNHFNARILKALLVAQKGNFIEAEKILLSNVQFGCEDDLPSHRLQK